MVYKTEEEEIKKINYKYDKADYSSIQDEIARIDWKESFEGKTVEEMWKIFRNNIIGIRDNKVPIGKVYKRAYPK